MKYEWELTEEEFGPFYSYIQDKNVTDIDYNGRTLWIADLKRGRYQANAEISEEFVERFTHRIANRVNKPFNRTSNVLEAETNELRISIVHESVAVSGRSICIRKSLPSVRHTVESMLDSGYCTLEILSLLINCVKAKMNFAFAENQEWEKRNVLSFSHVLYLQIKGLSRLKIIWKCIFVRLILKMTAWNCKLAKI